MDAKIDQRKYELAIKEDIRRLKGEILSLEVKLLRGIYLTLLGSFLWLLQLFLQCYKY